jgi:very-short-patch-repair endonuclease
MRRDLIQRARHMRAHPTRPEKIMWQCVRRKQLGGFKFRRQHVMEPYIVDFYCAEKKLVVELDGTIHEATQQAEVDRKRDRLLEEYDATIMRVENDEVLDDLEGVLERILLKCVAL